MRKKLKRIVLRNACLFGFAFLFLAVLRLLGITCPLLELTDYPCPTCGVTRAMVALVTFRFADYLRYNALAPFLCVAVLLTLNLDFFPKKKAITVFAIAVAVVNLFYWLYRLHFVFF